MPCLFWQAHGGLQGRRKFLPGGSFCGGICRYEEREGEREGATEKISLAGPAAVDVIMMAAPMARAVVVSQRDDTARIVTVIAAAWLLQFLSRRILPNTPTVLTR